MSAELPKQPDVSAEEKALINRDLADLSAAEAEHHIDLKSRTQFGIDPAAMMVLRDIKPLAETVARGFAADIDMNRAWDLIDELHKNGPWKRAEDLAAATDPYIQTYLVLASACREKTSKSGMTPAEYLADRRRVFDELQTFRPDQLPARIQNLFDRAKDTEVRTRTVDGKEIKVLLASGDPALPAAMKGLHGVVAKGGDMRFAQTAVIDDRLLENAGLQKGFAEVFDVATQGFKRVALDTAPKGARVIWVKAEEAGKPIDSMTPVAKRIGTGFVLTYKNEDLAVDLIAAVEAEQNH